MAVGLPWGLSGKNLPAKQETLIQSLVREIPWRRAWKPTPVFLPGESHGQRGLAGCSPWGRRESDTAKATEHARVMAATGNDGKLSLHIGFKNEKEIILYRASQGAER